jgi:hypothetical protein
VPDLLTSIREELAGRLQARREAVEEPDLLEAALRVPDASAGDGRDSRSPSRAYRPALRPGGGDAAQTRPAVLIAGGLSSLLSRVW